MTMRPSYGNDYMRVPAEQQAAFDLAMAERLGLNVDEVIANIDFDVQGGDTTGEVRVRFALPAEEILTMWQEARPAKHTQRTLEEALTANIEALCACDGAGCEETYARRVLVRLLDEQKSGA